jgi:uncharacterized protein (TIGR00369 family)
MAVVSCHCPLSSRPSPSKPRDGEGRICMEPQSFRQLLGYRTLQWSEGYAEIGVDVGPQHRNNLGKAHGGLYATLLDAALGHSVTFCPVAGHARYAVTTSLTTTFLASADEGAQLIAMGRLYAVTGRLAACSGEVRDTAGTLYALGQATFLYQPGSERPEGVPKRVRDERAAPRKP